MITRVGQLALGGLTAWGFATQGGLFGGIAAICLALSFLPELVERRVQLPACLAPGWAALLVAHVALGMGLDLYATSTTYDKVVHVLAFVWIAVCLSQKLAMWEAEAVPVPGRAAVVLLAAMGLGASWELVEFAIDLGGVVVTQPSLRDTMLDLVCDGVGAALVLPFSRTSAPTRAAGLPDVG